MHSFYLNISDLYHMEQNTQGRYYPVCTAESLNSFLDILKTATIHKAWSIRDLNKISQYLCIHVFILDVIYSPKFQFCFTKTKYIYCFQCSKCHPDPSGTHLLLTICWFSPFFPIRVYSATLATIVLFQLVFLII